MNIKKKTRTISEPWREVMHSRCHGYRSDKMKSRQGLDFGKTCTIVSGEMENENVYSQIFYV